MQNVIEFEAELVIESSYSYLDIGAHFNRMELKVDPDTLDGYIIWNYGEKAADEDEIVIGLSFNENGELSDYDGVYSLPKEALYLLKSNGYKLDIDMMETYPDDDYEFEKKLRGVDDEETMNTCDANSYYDWSMQ
jgi:hypothetical protein